MVVEQFEMWLVWLRDWIFTCLNSILKNASIQLAESRLCLNNMDVNSLTKILEWNMNNKIKYFNENLVSELNMLQHKIHTQISNIPLKKNAKHLYFYFN